MRETKTHKRMTMLTSLATFLLVAVLVRSSYGAIVQDDSGSSGRLRFFFDDEVANPCEHLVLLGAETTMSTSDYDVLSTELVTNEPIVTCRESNGFSESRLHISANNRSVDNFSMASLEASKHTRRDESSFL